MLSADLSLWLLGSQPNGDVARKMIGGMVVLRGRTALRALIVLCVLVAMIPLSGESPWGSIGQVNAAATGSKIRVTVLLSNAGDPYFSNKSYGYQEYANEDPGIDLQYFNAGGYDKLEVQLQQIENAVQRGTDVLLVTPVDAQGVCPAVGE